MVLEKLADEIQQVSDRQLHFSHLANSKSELPGFLLEIFPASHPQTFMKILYTSNLFNTES